VDRHHRRDDSGPFGFHSITPYGVAGWRTDIRLWTRPLAPDTACRDASDGDGGGHRTFTPHKPSRVETFVGRERGEPPMRAWWRWTTPFLPYCTYYPPPRVDVSDYCTADYTTYTARSSGVPAPRLRGVAHYRADQFGGRAL